MRLILAIDRLLRRCRLACRYVIALRDPVRVAWHKAARP